MKQIYSTLLLLVLLIFPSLLFATEPESVDRVPAIRGVVYDETDTPLASATVHIEGPSEQQPIVKADLFCVIWHVKFTR